MKAIISILIVTMSAASAGVYRTGNEYGYDMDTYARMDYDNQAVNLNNYQTGQYQRVNLNPDYAGGYTGTGIDIETGNVFNVNVDSAGNVNIHEF